jgi:DmsE family decaheme c-type cytochrome
MKQWQRIIAVCAASMGLSLLVPVSSALAASPKPAANDKDIVLQGDAMCTKCHDEADGPDLLAIGKTRHGTLKDSRTPSCVSCHGDSDPHRNYKGSGKPPRPDYTFGKTSTTPAEERSNACLGCHQKDAKRSHWAGSAHDTNEVSCNVCHKVHVAKDAVRDKQTQTEVCFTCHKEQRSQVNKPSHHPVMEGKVACSDCHNVHGSTGPKLMKRDSVNDTCYTCHMEKRGPFVHSHQPVDEDCTTCHNPHGTTAESLLKTRPPFLCHTCHTPHAATQPSAATSPAPAGSAPGWWNGSAITQGRACLNCHTQIHGSNNPSGLSPTPRRFFR